MRSPSETVKEMFWKSGVSPNCFEIPLALIIGGTLGEYGYFAECGIGNSDWAAGYISAGCTDIYKDAIHAS
jgi:hypothetical protein